jgi:glycyl-tRNA synthetase
MMLKTQLGSFSDSSTTGYLRPETAQGIFINYKNIVDSMHPKVPFGVAQIGKAYRNEITPRNFIFRLRELEQMEIEYFIHPSTWEAEFTYWIDEVLEWMELIGLDMNKVHNVEISGTDRAHYSQRTIDFEFEYPFGQKELYGLAYRGDYDLSKHAEASKIKLQYTDPLTNETFTPHVIEPSMGLDRTILAILCSAYREDELGGNPRTYMALNPQVAPYKIAVSPLVKNKEHIVAKAEEVFGQLKSIFGNVTWDDNGNVGKRYRRQDEIGTPFCVVVDYDTLEEGNADYGTVSIRHRDTGEQERVVIDKLLEYFTEKLS